MPGAERRRTRSAVAVALVAALAVVLWGGYRDHWHWTGFHQHNTLWDWLEMLALPLAVGIAPLWARHGRSLRRTQRLLLATLALALLDSLLPGTSEAWELNTLLLAIVLKVEGKSSSRMTRSPAGFLGNPIV